MVTSYTPNAVIIKPKFEHYISIIWLHGLGADGHDFAPIVPELDLIQQNHIQFVFPHAPKRAITINGGLHMRAWYDIKDPDLTQKPDKTGIIDSSNLLNTYIQNEIKLGIPTEKIVLAGFSQGGAIALYCGVHYPKELAGILALSTYLPFANELTDRTAKTPIMLAHGQQDPVIPIDLGKASYNKLLATNCNASWHEYTMPHSVCEQEIQDIKIWLDNILGHTE